MTQKSKINFREPKKNQFIIAVTRELLSSSFHKHSS